MNRFRDLIKSRKPPVTLEAPLIRDKNNLENFLNLFKEYGLDRWVIGINTLNNPMGNISTDPIILGHLIQSRLDIEAIPHVSVSLENNYTLSRWLLGASILDINNLLILSGDTKVGRSLTLNEAVGIINMFKRGKIVIGEREYTVPKRDFFIGGALLPERKDEYRRTLFKIKLGMEFFQTQVLFHDAALKNVINQVNREYDKDRKIYVLVSIVPYLNKKIVNILGGGALKIDIHNLSELPKHDYVSFIDSLILNIFESLDDVNENISIGLHIIPIFWNEDIIDNILMILSNLP